MQRILLSLNTAARNIRVGDKCSKSGLAAKNTSNKRVGDSKRASIAGVRVVIWEVSIHRGGAARLKGVRSVLPVVDVVNTSVAGG
jgi:hypothetical protein